MCLHFLIRQKRHDHARRSTQPLPFTPTSSTTSSRICASCGQYTTMTGKYCHICGAKLGNLVYTPDIKPNPKSITPKLCWSCDQVVANLDQYCSLCGVQLHDV